MIGVQAWLDHTIFVRLLLRLTNSFGIMHNLCAALLCCFVKSI